MREFLKELELDKEVVDKIMAEYGKSVKTFKDEIEGYKTDIEDYKNKVANYEKKIDELTELSKDSTKVQEELDKMKNEKAEREQQEKAKKDDEVLTNNIVAIFGDKKFTSEYAKNGLISDIKKELKKEENTGKGIKDIFEELTKDSTDIFANPNQVQDMAPMGDMDSTVSKEDFDKMSYKQRIELKAENPELFAKYNS